MNRAVMAGGASGLGRHLAIGFAEHGYDDKLDITFSEENIHCFQTAQGQVAHPMILSTA